MASSFRFRFAAVAAALSLGFAAASPEARAQAEAAPAGSEAAPAAAEAPPAPPAAPKAWDQKAVTALATKLAGALKDLNVTVRKTPEATMGSPNRRAQYQVREEVKLLVSISQRLATQLREGEDKDATLPTYRRLQSVRRDAAESGRKAGIPAPTLEKVVSARAVLDELEPYYLDAPEAAAPAPSAEAPAGATP